MKKILFLLVAIVSFQVAVNAQNKAADKGQATAQAAKAKTKDAPKVAAGVPLKADGTPDMRYKANQKPPKKG